jgi:hypothetical protein
LRSTGLRAFDRWYQGQNFVAVADLSIAAIFQYETDKITHGVEFGGIVNFSLMPSRSQ